MGKEFALERKETIFMTSQYLKEDTLKREREISTLLHRLGVPAHIKGYQYIKYGIMLGLDNPDILNSVTKELYPAIAEKYDSTSSRVERSIRHAIEQAFFRGSVTNLERIFGYTIHSDKGKPTNSEFIALLSDYLRLHMVA